jgi:hypothetical protein
MSVQRESPASPPSTLPGVLPSRQAPASPPRDAPTVERPASTFDVDGARSEDAVTVLLHGDLSPATVPHLRTVLEGVVLLRPHHVVIDLSDVRHLGPETLRLMLGAAGAGHHPVLRSPYRGSSPSSTCSGVASGSSDGDHRADLAGGSRPGPPTALPVPGGLVTASARHQL